MRVSRPLLLNSLYGDSDISSWILVFSNVIFSLFYMTLILFCCDLHCISGQSAFMR